MEIRKSNSVVSTVTQESTSSETKKSDKSVTRGISSAKDSFEVSSSSNQENSGTKQLSAAEQREASKSNYKDFGNNGSTSQTSRSTYEDAKNSGLAVRLGHNKETSEPDSKKELPNGVTVADIKNSPAQTEQSSVAVKDAQQKLNGDGRTNYRESLDQELARRRQDFTGVGGSSAIDRALNSPHDPATEAKGKGSAPTGADAVAYDTSTNRTNKDGTTTIIKDHAFQDAHGTIVTWHTEATLKDKIETQLEKKTELRADNTKAETNSKTTIDYDKNVVKRTETSTTYDKDGNVTESKTTSTTTPFSTSKPMGGGSKQMPGGEDRESANIPDDIKKGIEYDMQQIRNSKPKDGGETELTDGGVTGNSADGSGPINNAFTRTGGVMGAVAQPTRAGEYVGGPSNGTVGSAVQNGGATDSLDGSSWTGTTHQDDPADVQFGPADQPKEQASTKKSEDSNSSVLDQISNRKSKKAE
jgi:hypothetical protein